MTRNIVNIGVYKYLVEYFDANTDMQNNQYFAEFVMLRNFNVLNNIIYDTDIYIIEKKFFNEYKNELKESKKDFGKTLAFPITNIKVNSYSDSYKKFNNIYNIYENDINDALFNESELSTSELSNVYELYEIVKKNNVKQLHNASIKCNKIRLYHPLVKKRMNMIVDVCNYINGINFHYLCKPINNYKTYSETEIKFNNETYSEFIELYFPNIDELFKFENDEYKIFYKEDFNIITSTQNEKFINSIMSNSDEIEHYEDKEGVQIIPLNLLIQPYRIIEEYAADSVFNYNDTVADDEKMFVKLYIKNNVASLNNYSSNVSVIFYPYINVDENTHIYMSYGLRPGYLHNCNESKFRLMSRTGFSDGIISIVSMFEYPNKSYFYNKAKNINDLAQFERSSFKDYNDYLEQLKRSNLKEYNERKDDIYVDYDAHKMTSPIQEAYKYYYNVDDHYYSLFINDEIEQELRDIDAVESISPEIIKTVIEVDNINYVDKTRILERWKQIMKETILEEYEEEFKTPANFLGFKIQLATDVYFKHIIYDRNIRVNFYDLDDFSFKLNGIFKTWKEKPEQLICKICFYDRLLGIEITSNLVIITKEWFKYLINDNGYVPRLSDISLINKENDYIDMKVVNLNFSDEIQKLNTLENKIDNVIYDETGSIKTNDVNISVEYLNAMKNAINEVIENLQGEATNKINFINNIKCIVNKKANDTISLQRQTYNQKIIFKPIFYKAKDLQNITLRPKINQKVGINLSDYLSKIESFKIVIDNVEYVEIGRNNIFVIFDINTNNLTETSGIYNLIDNAGNYISSGNWKLDV